MRSRANSQECSGRGVKLTTDFHLEPRLSVSRTVNPTYTVDVSYTCLKLLRSLKMAKSQSPYMSEH